MSDWYIRDEGLGNKNSILDLMIGKCIGSGASRRVYEVRSDKSLVLKVEYEGGTFHNQQEWLIWKEMKDWPIADWFAPCVDIDGYGNVLIQRRTEPFTSEKDFRIALQRTRGGVIPDIFSDIHYANFGMLDGRVTCHDYGYHAMYEGAARRLSIDAGYLTIDDCDPDERRDYVEEDQYELNL